MPGGTMPNRLERLLYKMGEFAEFILGSIFYLAGAVGIADYIFHGYINRVNRYVDSIIGLQGPAINIPHSLAFLAIMVVFIFIGMILMVDDLSKVF
jgi:ABC-type maltose transport system permease subunit